MMINARLLLLVLIGSFSSFSQAELKNPDIAGIQLGMTPEQVEIAMKKYDQTIVIKKQENSFQYSALNKRYTTPPFLAIMQGQIPGKKTTITVGFSAPPSMPQVISINRNQKQDRNPISRTDFSATLVDKYGNSDEESIVPNGTQPMQVYKWHLQGSGKRQCLAGQGYLAPGSQATQKMVTAEGRRLANPTVDNVKDCASLLMYVLNGDPVVLSNGYLFDTVKAAKTEFETQKWIDQLILEKTTPSKEKPKL